MASLALKNLFHEKVRFDGNARRDNFFGRFEVRSNWDYSSDFIAATSDILYYSNADLWITSQM